MISITEKPTVKCPGLSSLFIEFEYRREIVDCIKNSGDIAVYDKKSKIWECPITSLSRLIESLSNYEDIELTLMDECKEDTVKDIVLNTNNYITQPYKYQVNSIKYGLQHDKWLLLDAPGLGKTLQMLYLAQELKNRKNIEHCLIICGVNTLKNNWKNEILKHTNLSCRILGEKVSSRGKISIGSISERVEQLKNKLNEFFIITNIETLRDDDIVKYIENGPNKFDMIVLDEAHACKSPASQQGKHLLKLKKAKYKIAMTGTLLLNNPLDAYVPLKWIGKEKSTYTNYKYYYCQFGGNFNNILMGYKHVNVLKDQLTSCSLRRTKDLLDLPPKTVINETIDMNKEHEAFYNDIVNGVVNNVDKVNLTTTSLLAMVTRLRQASSCPSILTTKEITSSKIERCIELVDEILSNDSKIVIFNTFKETANILYDKLKNYNPVLCTGDVQDNIINSNIDKFQNDPDCKLFIGTWQKCGTGITLTAANYMIFLDTPWTQGVYEQAQDRIYRIGTKDSVFIYNLICKNTIDERVKDILATKGAISDYIVDDVVNETTINYLREYISTL